MKRIVTCAMIACHLTSVYGLEPITRYSEQNTVTTMHTKDTHNHVAPHHTHSKEFTMEPSIGISKELRDKVAQLLNTLLASNFVLYTKLLNYHWNLKSVQFNDLHAFFKSLYEQQFSVVDDIAERVQTIGFVALGSLKEFSSRSLLTESHESGLSDQQMLKNLLNDYEALIRTTREYADKTLDFKDAGTNNFLIDLIEKQEKSAWMIRSSIK